MGSTNGTCVAQILWNNRRINIYGGHMIQHNRTQFEILQEEIKDLKHDLYEAKESNIGLRGAIQSFITTNTILVEQNESLQKQINSLGGTPNVD